MKIAFILYPQVLATGVTIPIEMFNAAVQSRSKTNEGLEVVFVAERKGPVEVTAGVQLIANRSFDDDVSVDWIFLPPMWGSPWSVISAQQKLHGWLVDKYTAGSRIIATGTGVGMMAMSGLLDNRVATTHWYYLPKFRKRFEHIRFQTEHFITHQDGIYCAGSINAQTDLVLYFIERTWGEDALALVEQQFMHELKRNFSTPYYEPGGQVHDDEVVSLVQGWVRTHFAEHIQLKQLAQISGHSERQLSRRFLKATEETPMQYVYRIRIEEAQDLLRETNLSITDISLSVGFNHSAYFSRSFRSTTGMSAGEYRKMVRKKQFSS